MSTIRRAWVGVRLLVLVQEHDMICKLPGAYTSLLVLLYAAVNRTFAAQLGNFCKLPSYSGSGPADIW